MKGLKPKVQYQRKHLMEFFFHIPLRREEKDPKPQLLFLMLEAKHDNL